MRNKRKEKLKKEANAVKQNEVEVMIWLNEIQNLLKIVYSL